MNTIHAAFLLGFLSLTASCTSEPKDRLVLPSSYEQKTAEAKLQILFHNVERTRFEKLPPLESVNAFQFVFGPLGAKLDGVGDEAPVGYKKSIHRRAMVAKVSFEAYQNPFTGLFQGVPFGLIRLSVTSDPKGTNMAPGLALKLLVDGQPSANVSALYKLSGQGSDHNFFAHELSNVIPKEYDMKSIFSSAVFRLVSPHPTKISVEPFAELDAKGQKVESPKAPVQLYFVPNPSLSPSSEPHDFREDLAKIPEGTWLYDVFASTETGDDERQIDNERRERAVKIGRIVTRSAFLASDFGDRRLFFRHYRYGDK